MPKSEEYDVKPRIEVTSSLATGFYLFLFYFYFWAVSTVFLQIKCFLCYCPTVKRQPLKRMASGQVQGPQKSTTTPLPPKHMKLATPQAHSHDYITTQEATPVTDLLDKVWQESLEYIFLKMKCTIMKFLFF